MLRQADQMKEEEGRQAQVKIDRAKVVMGEVEEANKAALVMKDSKKKEEKDLEMKIVDYNKQKALREEEKMAED